MGMIYPKMSLYYADNSNQLFFGDARRLDLIKDKSVDMVLNDPSYGIDYVTGHRKRSPKSVVATLERFDPIAADKYFPHSLMRESLEEAHRVLKDNTAIYIFTRWDSYHKLLPIVQEFFTVKNVITWGKNNWTAGDLVGNYAYQTEIILFAVKGRHRLIGRRDTNLLLFKRVDGAKLIHPAQKPVELLSYLITKSCPERGVVLDQFCGVGSTGVAASNTGRRSINIDINHEWLGLAKKRLEHKYLPLMGQTEVAPQNFRMLFEGDEK